MSIGRFSDYQAQRWLETFSTTGCYLALHYDNPDVAGAYASEVFGNSYARVKSGFTGVENRTVWNLDTIRWKGLPTVVVTHVAGWDASRNGNLLWSSSLDSIVRVTQGSGFSLGPRTIGLSVN